MEKIVDLLMQLLLGICVAYLFMNLMDIIHNSPLAKQNLEYILIALILFWIIADTIRLNATSRVFGIPSLIAFRKMWAIDAVRAKTQDVGYRLYIYYWIFYGSICTLISLIELVRTGETVFFLISAFIFLFVFGRAITHTGMLPCILLLATSGQEATKFHQRLVKSNFYIFRVVSLLEHDANAEKIVSGGFIYFGNLRTTSASDWTRMVGDLMNISPIILVDMRKMGDALEREIGLIFETGQVGKTFILSNNREKLSNKRGMISLREPILSEIRRAIDPSRIHEPADFIEWFKMVVKSPKLLPEDCRFG